jgi:hypothetical protein
MQLARLLIPVFFHPEAGMLMSIILILPIILNETFPGIWPIAGGFDVETTV